MGIASQETRIRAIEAYNEGTFTQQELANQFHVRKETIRRWINEARQGKFAPAKRGHNPRKLTLEDEEQLKELLTENPGILLRELKEQYYPHVSLTTLSRAIARIGLSAKVRHQKLARKDS